MDARTVLAARLATQRLTGPPAASPTDVVRGLLAVQAQDAPLAQAMVALRCAGTATDVAAAVASGAIVRTHVLRPTWHYVAACDLRPLLQLTSPKVESGMASRHRQLDLDGPRLDSALDAVRVRLDSGHASRDGLGDTLVEAGTLDRTDPRFGQQVGHVLLVAELRALICSAPVPGPEHRYALAEVVLPPAAPFDRDHALDDLVGRFVAGHGPVALTDLQRWARVTLAEARAALGRLDGFARIVVDGEELWHSPAAGRTETRPRRAWLLSTFDEAFLSYRRVGWKRSPGNPDGPDERRFSQSGGGPVLCDGMDVGGWKRRWERGRATIRLSVDPGLSRPARRAVDEAVDRLLAAIGPATA